MPSLNKKGIAVNPMTALTINIFSSPARSPIIPANNTAMDLTAKEIIIKRPLAAEGCSFAFSWIMANITGVVERTVNPVMASMIIFRIPVEKTKINMATGATSRTQNNTLCLPSQSLKVPALNTPATPNASYKARAAPPYPHRGMHKGSCRQDAGQRDQHMFDFMK